MRHKWKETNELHFTGAPLIECENCGVQTIRKYLKEGVGPCQGNEVNLKKVS